MLLSKSFKYSDVISFVKNLLSKTTREKVFKILDDDKPRIIESRQLALLIFIDE